MTIPIDRLYHYIDNLANKEYNGLVVIYGFWPHGSKNINDLNMLKPVDSWFQLLTAPIIWCHDQEPLNYDLYAGVSKEPHETSKYKKIQEALPAQLRSTNINYNVSVFDKSILLHSEKRSTNLEKYLQPPTNLQSQLLSVYYWSHAIISRDWFRYAQHEQINKNVTKQFLIYNRAWSGTREYRLKFTELLIQNNLVDHCLTFCNPVDTSIHYRNYQFKNPVWQPTLTLEEHLPPSFADSAQSADFDIEDYNSTEIEVVLETLFDDERLHLTEKSLRPIACRQPFILVATHGSLQYLRDYGFKTFDTVWDENYDTIIDPFNRMLAVIDLMKNIQSWSPEEKIKKSQHIEEIVTYNQKHFFSDEFFNLVILELKNNLSVGFEKIKSAPRFDKWASYWDNHFLKFDFVQTFLDTNQDIRYPTRTQYNLLKQFIANSI
jgi:hypothetical protein